ncbi:DNA polymerase III subunit gamma/tau [Bacteriovorax sp. Seq25_V]|uniref:DNA polymerase III subunit gamma/tau n=1 Tax=Bacteriovorax sp. Seq25_V TaxID=1201288 RepID=UPI000389DA03|nr:DNA polymerase III subunit gamma/tau [Bacteriovorax sp. Seq25_V]EQC43506.1 DNA polymerase III, subunit gamma and tau [Bacteriovorax sp. Seq25_V]
MSYQVLARKWRPQKLEDVVGQEHIIRSLQNSLREDRVGHAYIFSGTRGIGKTSVARLFAKSLRCTERLADGNACGKCSACEDFNTSSSMNIIEIDGASNNSVEDVRDLIGNIQYVPTTGKYKVYIIDEVHMLSTSAFNALLKTLEEPPSHAVFILATTEPDKLLGTVLSRCQRFDFRNAEIKDLVAHIKHIASVENIKFENDNLITELAKLGSGSFRDTLSLLDQVLSFSIDGNITEEIFARSLGIARIETMKSIIDGIVNGNVEALSAAYRSALYENVSAKNIAKAILETAFQIVIAKDYKDFNRVSSKISAENFEKIGRAEIYWIYEVLSTDITWAISSMCPEDALELVFRKVALRHEFMAEVQGGAQVAQGKPVTNSVAAPISKSVPVEQPVSKLEVVEAPVEVVKPEAEPIKIVIPMPEPESTTEKIEEVVEEVQAPSIEKEKSNEPKDWNGFLSFLRSVSPAASANLEQGNLLSPISYTAEMLSVELGYPMSSKVFYDYLNEKEAFDKLMNNLSNYFQIDHGKIDLKIQLVGKEEAEEQQFKSKIEIKYEAEQERLKQMETNLVNDPVIKHAETIFNSKVDKITLNDKK